MFYLTGPGLSCSLQVLIFSCSMRTLSCGMWDLVPWPGIKPGPPALGAWSLTHWTTREVHRCMFEWEQSPDFPSFLDILECHWKGIVHRQLWAQKGSRRAAVLYTLSAINSHWILKSRDSTLPTKVHLLKAMVFSVVMYGCESWTIKKAEHQRTDAFELWC